MMPPRPAARPREDLRRIMAAVPTGRVVAISGIAAHLGMMPGRVAQLLAALRDEQKEEFTWHRAVGGEGQVLPPAQRALLAAEGAAFDAEGCLADAAAGLVEVAALPHGVPPRPRPASTPTPRRLRMSETSAARGPAGRNR